jgi:hypothetical protein
MHMRAYCELMTDIHTLDFFLSILHTVDTPYCWYIDVLPQFDIAIRNVLNEMATESILNTEPAFNFLVQKSSENLYFVPKGGAFASM